jgi:uncharacterized protein with HEPN domain
MEFVVYRVSGQVYGKWISPQSSLRCGTMKPSCGPQGSSGCSCMALTRAERRSVIGLMSILWPTLMGRNSSHCLSWSTSRIDSRISSVLPSISLRQNRYESPCGQEQPARPFLLFDSCHSALQDILESIDLIEQFTSGMNLEAFRSDQRTMAAVERKLQIISEAAIRVGERPEEVCPGLPWRDIREIGNWLRYEYFRLTFRRYGGRHQSICRPFEPLCCAHWIREVQI